MRKFLLRVRLVNTNLSLDLLLELISCKILLSIRVLACQQFTALSQLRCVLSINALRSLLSFILVLLRLSTDHLNLSLVNVQWLLLHGRLPLVEARVFNLNLLLVLSTASIASYINLNYLLKKAILTILSVHVWLTGVHRATVKRLGISLILLILSAVHQFHRLLVVLLTLLIQKL